MKFDRLRIIGFKTFIDPTELVIETGLTGVVGPNGCGKSNLVEALRWVMGETSHKSMRASGMDDVIFSGSGQRPARNHAEVMLRVDNGAREAPAAFNDADFLEISRRIEREAGSTYRINGREVRARDVQLLFADAASGARSPSMVRQGQISEIISAKPQARRRILEDAAGIAGLHARRHDAELKLKAAEENLARVVDVLTHIDGQIDGLKRQARQAERYRTVAADIRRAEAVVRQREWHGASALVEQAGRQLDLDTRAVASAMTEQGEAERQRAVAQHAIAPLRQEEAKAGELLQRLVIAREALDGEERRAKSRQEELDRRIVELARDLERARRMCDDATAALTRLTSEQTLLSAESGGLDAEPQARERLSSAEAEVQQAEATLQEIQTALAEATARRSVAESGLAEANARLARLKPQLAETERQAAQLAASASGAPDLEVLRASVSAAAAALESSEAGAQQAEVAHRAAREQESRLRPALQEADRAAQRLETEARTIRKLFDSGASDLWPRVVDQITVAKGYEMALGAAFGDDLEASTATTAPAHWAGSPIGPEDPPLPEGAEPLSAFVEAPTALARRLAQVGVVERSLGEGLRSRLQPGQRLVSREGDLWRWDGFTAAAEAPTAAARRLAEKNRLGDIEAAATQAAGKRDVIRVEVERSLAAARAAALSESSARDAVREARRRFDLVRDQLVGAERRHAEFASRKAALAEAGARLAVQLAEAEAAREAAEAAFADAGDSGDLPQRSAEQRVRAAELRSLAAEARAALQGMVREKELRARRLDAIAEERAAWQARRAAAEAQAQDVEARLDATRRERSDTDGLPAELLARRRLLAGEIESAEGARRVAADARAEGETILLTFDRVAREALTALSNVREQRARSETQLEAAKGRLVDLTREIEETLGVSPSTLGDISGIARPEDLSAAQAAQARLDDLRRERERIGAVNLRADQELAEVVATRADLAREHDELGEAIRKLRRGIDSLNAEGRNRLVAAFEVVNGHFKTLFTRLFGGGSAELQLIESDDPLEAGLEIMAHPPGKKPQVLTLLSGGEQALTATALIFAVFLTNPSPVCVLDEVDAPLDDSNVERLCDLLADMARETETRFVIITHNPITMARMDRLFGVTMAERGVSQLVSVDLEAAERLAEAS